MSQTDEPKWTPWYCSITHLMVGRSQRTVSNFKNFAQLDFYSWDLCRLTEQCFFFVNPYKVGKSADDRTHYWNCGSIDRAIAIAKLYATGAYQTAIDVNKMNLRNFSAREYGIEFGG